VMVDVYYVYLSHCHFFHTQIALAFCFFFPIIGALILINGVHFILRLAVSIQLKLLI